MPPKPSSIKPEERLYGRSWFNALHLSLEGQGWSDTEKPYDRLPARAKEVVREPVWSLSQNTSGLRVRFVTDAPVVDVRWCVRRQPRFDHMPDTGVSGIDLYVKDDGAWHFCGVGRVTRHPDNYAYALASSLPPGPHEFMIHLPLYNGIEWLHVGVPNANTIRKAPAYPRGKEKPLLFYGTSVTNGGCASRPGMAYPSIVARMLDRPLINIAFDGNALHEPEVAELLGELDPAVFVLDSPSNMGPDMTRERTEPFVRAIRKARPKTPIVMMEGFITRTAPVFKAFTRAPVNTPYRAAFDRILSDGDKKISYVPVQSFFDGTGDTSVDGSHPTDWGFQIMAASLLPYLKKVL